MLALWVSGRRGLRIPPPPGGCEAAVAAGQPGDVGDAAATADASASDWSSADLKEQSHIIITVRAVARHYRTILNLTKCQELAWN